MDPLTCADCQRFHQHYVRVGRGTYRKTGLGHCSYPRLKSRRSTFPACEKFLPRAEHT